MPFAVVGSNTVMDVNGKRVRGRQYPWGTVEVDNLEHNDFLALRDMLIRYNTYTTGSPDMYMYIRTYNGM